MFQQTRLHPQNVGVCYVILKYRVIGPISHEQTANSEEYQHNLTDSIVLCYKGRTQRLFQQDNTKPRISDSLMAFIREFFKERVISLDLWPPRNPNLSLAGILLRAFLKDVVYKNQPTTLV